MATVAEFSLEPAALPFGGAFDELPGATVLLEPTVPDADGVVAYFWVLDAGTDDVADLFRDRPGLRDVRPVDAVDDEHLLRCRWVSDGGGVLDALVAPDVVVRSGVGTADGWTLEVRGETQEDVSTFQRYCQSHDVAVTLSALHGLRPLDVRYALTKKQRRALVLAYERGYFDSPRRATLAEVADELDISQQALASRLRRGTRRLVEQVFTGPGAEAHRRRRV